MSSIFRHEKTNRVLCDDLVRCPLTTGFWEAPSGQISASGSLLQPIQTLAGAGATAFSGASAFSQIIQALNASGYNLTTAGSFTQPNQTLAGAGVTSYKTSGGLTQPVETESASGYETFLASLSASQPIAVIASDGKQTYSGQIVFAQGVPTLELNASETQSGTAHLIQFLQTFSGYGEMGPTTPQGVEAHGAFWQRPQRMFGSARIVPKPFMPSLLPMEVVTGRKYRMIKRYSYDKSGKRTFVGRSRY